MRTESVASSTWAVPPGHTIRDLMAARHLSTHELAESIDLAEETVEELLRGTEPLTELLAARLATVLGASTSFWLRREAHYRTQLHEESASPDPADRGYQQWMKSLPLKDMVKLGWLEEATSATAKLRKCLDFFGVPNLNAWNASYEQIADAVAFRTSEAYPANALATAAWLRQGEILSEHIKCSAWNSMLFREALIEARKLTLLADPSDFVPKLQTLCASAGVSVVIVKAPTGCRASGATFFTSPERAVLMLSGRYLTDDQFWFSFFHEAGHLLLHWNFESPILETSDGQDEQRETEANEFAAAMLLPTKYQELLPEVGDNLRSILRLARNAGIAPGIVVGQLQHKGLVKQGHFNKLKARYKWH